MFLLILAALAGQTLVAAQDCADYGCPDGTVSQLFFSDRFSSQPITRGDPSQLHTLPRIKSPSNAHLYRQPPYDVVTGGLIGFQWYPSMENDDQHRDLVLIDL